MKRIELLAPAGDMERLKIAFLYGADAVYIGGRNYSLRANAINFSIEQIKEACMFAHELKKKVYVTINIVFHDEDTEGLVSYLRDLENASVDAIIVSDPAVIKVVKDNNIKLEIHISTQASVVNSESAKFFHAMGASRVVLGRECNRDEIKAIIDKSGVEVETFIHGAMCASYSGRCVLSNYFTNRDANRGGCAQICRFVFDLEDDTKVYNEKTKFTMASKDLSMLSYIPDMIDIGISSLKIEGRMRSIYYIATVVNSYRRVIDAYYEGTLTDRMIKYYQNELEKVSNRDSIVHFYKGLPNKDNQYYLNRKEESKQDFLALVDSYQDGYVTVISKNYFETGDIVEMISPNRDTFSFVVPVMYNMDLEEITVSNHPEEKVRFKLDKEVLQFDMMRKKKN